MQKLPASAGWAWIKQGWALFRKQPFELATLSLLYFLVLGAMSILPLAGALLVFILKPAMSMAFMQAGADVERGKRVYPALLLTGFRTPALRTLLFFGVASLGVAALALGLSTLIDGGMLWKLLQGKQQFDSQAMNSDSLTLSMLAVTALYLPVEMALWYAPALAVWQGMGAGKALFFSFFAAKRSLLPFTVFGLAWFGIFILLSPLAMLVGAMLGEIAMIFFISVLAAAVYCSIYPTYTAVFGKPYSDQTDHSENQA